MTNRMPSAGGGPDAPADAATAPAPPQAGGALADYIVRMPGALPTKLCDGLLAEFSTSTEWKATPVSSGKVDRDVRDADAISISERAVIARNSSVRQPLDSALFAHCATVVQRYNRLFPHCRVRRDSGFELLRYQPGGFYREHADSDAAFPRELACSFLLNGDFSGGEFAFFGGARRVPMLPGDAIVFPANFMYPHQILPVTDGIRYAVVTWFL